MFNQIKGNLPFYVFGRAVAGYAKGTGIALTYQGYSQTSFASGDFNNDDATPDWTNGTGTPINTTGTLIFENRRDGGSLADLLIANRGNNTVYFGFNDSTISLTNGTPLASGESAAFGPTLITKVWAITDAGTSAVTARGSFNTNPYNSVHR